MSEIERLRDRVAELEDVLGLSAKIPRAVIKFTPREAGEAMIGILLAREFVPNRAMYDVLFGARSEADQPKENYLSVIVCKLRKALAPHGIAIETQWGQGWFLTAENKRKLRELLEEKAAA